MRGIEGDPFWGDIEKIGSSTSCDSSVVLFTNHSSNEQHVIKWNRRPIASIEEGLAICKFINCSLDLYRDVLGVEYIPQTDLVLGEKKDGSKRKIKIYEVQPYISGWDGKTLPQDLRRDPRLVEKWRNLYARLSMLYSIGYGVNREYAETSPSKVFPINLTLGNSRSLALLGEPIQNISVIPQTPNILIDRQTINLHLCDFGGYQAWSYEMQEAYDKILQRAVGAIRLLTTNS